jgi:endonuclease YncB( thermonuclease family)
MQDVTTLAEKLVHRSEHCEYVYTGTRYRKMIDAERAAELIEDALLQTRTIGAHPSTDMQFFPATCTATVTRIIDGDTYVIEWAGKEYVIRLIGADTFETRYSAKLRKQALRHSISMAEAIQKGRAASQFAESVLLGEIATLVRPDVSPDNDMFFRHLRTVGVIWANKPTDFAMLLRKSGHDEAILKPKDKSKEAEEAKILETRIWRVAYSFED